VNKHTFLFKQISNFLLIFVLVISLVLGMMPQRVVAFAGGDGTQGNPYLIANCVQLEQLDDNTADLSAYFALANDIDCSDTINWNGGQGWAPLGSFDDRFTGTLDGNGFNITGLYLNRQPLTGGFGLFSYVENATFKNFSIGGSISNSTDDLGTCSGALAPAAYGSVTIEDVRSTVNVSGTQDSVGGFIGCLIDGTGSSRITDSSVNATLAGGAVGGLITDLDISGQASMTVQNTTTAGAFTGNDVGGLARTFHYRTWDNTTNSPALTVDNFSSSADITVRGNGAGIVENLWLDYRTATIIDSSYTGTMEATAGSGVSGLINELESTNNTSSTEITRSYVSSLITSTSNDVGGLIGKVDADHSVSIEESYFGGIIDADGDRIGGLIAMSSGASSITDSYADAQITGDQYVGGLVGTGRVAIDSSFAFGSITSSGTVLGGLAGSLNDATVQDSFAAVSVPPNQPTTIGGLVGAVSGMTINNSYVDADRTEQACFITGDGSNPSTVNCNQVNGDGSNANYFFNNSTNPPLNQWDFTNKWETNQFFYPCLQWQDNCQTFQPQPLCEQPVATATTITGRCDIQVRSGYDYGQTTWEARFKRVDDTSYAPIILDDETEASTTVRGLQENTEYYLEFRFTNNWGTGEWARLVLITTDSPEITVPMSAAEDGSLINFDVYGCSRLGDWQTQKESSLSIQDTAFNYPYGLIAFNLQDCPVGGTATVNVTFTSNLDTSSVVFRKINENNKIFTVLTSANSNVNVIRTTLEGKPAIQVQYQITDGGLLERWCC
jgi:hypothetical protein